MSEEAHSEIPYRVKILAGTAGGLTFVHSSPTQGGVVELCWRGSWLGWRPEGFEFRNQSAAEIPASIWAGLRVTALQTMRPGTLRGDCWSGVYHCPWIAFTPGTTITFEPGLVQVERA